jgi:hypothetical protein
MPVEAVMFWNEPNNKSHWDFELDPDWVMFATMVKAAAIAVAEANPTLTRVLGGISPIDPGVYSAADEARGDRSAGCGCCSRLPAGLESLATSGLASEAGGD